MQTADQADRASAANNPRLCHETTLIPTKISRKPEFALHRVPSYSISECSELPGKDDAIDSCDSEQRARSKNVSSRRLNLLFATKDGSFIV